MWQAGLEGPCDDVAAPRLPVGQLSGTTAAGHPRRRQAASDRQNDGKTERLNGEMAERQQAKEVAVVNARPWYAFTNTLARIPPKPQYAHYLLPTACPSLRGHPFRQVQARPASHRARAAHRGSLTMYPWPPQLPSTAVERQRPPQASSSCLAGLSRPARYTATGQDIVDRRQMLHT